MNNLTFKVNENSTLKEYKIIKLCSKDNIDYVIYKDINGNDEIYASRYKVINNNLELSEIIDDKEWDFIDLELLNGEVYE